MLNFYFTKMLEKPPSGGQKGKSFFFTLCCDSAPKLLHNGPTEGVMRLVLCLFSTPTPPPPPGGQGDVVAQL